MRSGTRSRTATAHFVQPLSPDNRAAPARDDRVEQACQGSNPDQRGWSSPCCRLHHRPTVERTARIERASPEWLSGALPAELRSREYARLESNQRPLPSQSSARSAELRAFVSLGGSRARAGMRESLRQESNPHFDRTKGVCLPLTLRRHRWRRRESNPLLLGASEAFFQKNLIPRRVLMRTGGVEPPKPEATGLQPAELAVAQRPHAGGPEWKAGSAPRNRRQRRCRLWAPEPAVTHRHSCQRVSAPPPPRRLALEACRSQLHVRARALHQPLFRHFLGPPVGGPIVDSAGGIRTHGLELMRLAGTAAPLPRVARSARKSRGLAGWSRTSGLRFPKPAGWPSFPTAR